MLEKIFEIITQSRVEAEVARSHKIAEASTKEFAILKEASEAMKKGQLNTHTVIAFSEISSVLFDLVCSEPLGERRLVILSRFVVNLPPKRYS